MLLCYNRLFTDLGFALQLKYLQPLSKEHFDLLLNGVQKCCYHINDLIHHIEYLQKSYYE